MLCEDDPGVRAAFTGFIREVAANMNSAVFAFADGEAAIASLTEREYDLAIIDVALGRMSGYHVVEATRRVSPKTKIVVCSGAVTPELATEAKAAGADWVVAKSFDFYDQIVPVLEEAFRAKPTG